MEPAIDDLVVEVKAIAQGPKADLLLRLVDILYERDKWVIDNTNGRNVTNFQKI